MGDKRLKLHRGLGEFVPISVNFGDLEREMEENQVEYDPARIAIVDRHIVSPAHSCLSPMESAG